MVKWFWAGFWRFAALLGPFGVAYALWDFDGVFILLLVFIAVAGSIGLGFSIHQEREIRETRRAMEAE
jgi:hypothetical protein